MAIEIRKCDLADLDAIIQIGRLTFDETFRVMNTDETMDLYLNTAFERSKIEAEVRNPGTDFFFLYQEGELAGYIKINEGDAQTDMKDAGLLELERIYVKKQFQGLGLGRVLMDTAVQTARQRNKLGIWLGVWEKNEAAIGFYQRMGFNVAGSHFFVLGEERQTDFVMRMDF
jgi:diamine N-acetyltransferase